MTRTLTSTDHIIELPDYEIVRYDRKSQRDVGTRLGSDDFNEAKAMLEADPSLGSAIRSHKSPGITWSKLGGWE